MTDAIRPAATIVLWRPAAAATDTNTTPGFEVLMGQRGHAAAFMPSKYVFPGGGVDADDATTTLPGLTPDCAHRLTLQCTPDAPSPGTIAAAALRELAEETGLTLPNPAPGTLRFIFRAITPPGRTRRFDARFFLASAATASGDTAHFAATLTELSHLHWINLTQARALDLPFITEVVLAEVTALLNGQPQPGVPFFDNSGPVPTFRRL
ncbi:DNA mismatch repair protein MutT [Cypionkella aquatica]|uniref:DNA mismatch repair protein MutT n=1 Tax=Cypionkella aquatica TaxID=1756042 RepID=A0AA37WZP0_9RHOB|nr:NUDIX domain-containing protein [Cypionkella aquatica]GLS86943.1 DNA mismatch repair protein MutT [Cypionkella aquatica]